MEDKVNLMIVDCHYHLNESLLSVEELLKKMDESGVDKITLMANMCSPLPNVKESLLKLNRFFLTHRTLRWLGRKFTENFTPEGDFRILKKNVKIERDPNNQPVFDSVKNYPNKFWGWIFINPKGNDQLQEFNKWKDLPGAIGVKAHPFWHRFYPIELLPVAKQVAALGKPMLLHLGFRDYGDYNALLKEVPNLKLILAHTAFPYYSKIWKSIKDKPNVFVDLSQTMYVDGTTTRRVVKFLGADKCLFGTDGPFGSLGSEGKFDLGLIKRRIEKLFPDKNVQAKVLGENFLNLINA